MTQKWVFSGNSLSGVLYFSELHWAIMATTVQWGAIGTITYIRGCAGWTVSKAIFTVGSALCRSRGYIAMQLSSPTNTNRRQAWGKSQKTTEITRASSVSHRQAAEICPWLDSWSPSSGSMNHFALNDHKPIAREGSCQSVTRCITRDRP